MPASLTTEHLKGGKMAWKIKRDPELASIPTFKHPDRCVNCGHASDVHDAAVGCLCPGGTKYVENSEGQSMRVCSCLAFVPVPPQQLAEETVTNAIHHEETARLKAMSKEIEK